MGINEIIEISKPRIVVLLVITAVTSMYAASKLVDGVPDLDYLFYLDPADANVPATIMCK